MFLHGFLKFESMPISKKRKRSLNRLDGKCTKVVYATQEEAKRAAKSYGLIGNKQKEYLCNRCDFYHLTTVV